MSPSSTSLTTAARPPGGIGWRLAVAAVLVVSGVSIVWWASWGIPDAAWLLSRQADLQALHTARPWTFAACFFCCFTLLSALALPGCGLLALAAGLQFGLLWGTALVVVASTVGATASFLAARYLWRDAVQRRYGTRLAAIEDGLSRDGSYYLFSLRVAPLIPYGLVNPLMGLSKMPTRQFFWVSLIGMLAGSAVYVYAGTALVAMPGQMIQWRELYSPGVIGAFVLLALLPWCSRVVWRQRRASSASVQQ